MRHVLGTVALFSLLAVGCRDAASAKPGVVLLRYNPGSESTEQREAGFLDTLKKEYPDIHILSHDQYCGTTPESSLDKAQQMLLKYDDSIVGVFAVCEPNANGVLRALREAELAGQVKFVGFDPNEPMVKALSGGHMHGIVLQDPVKMGYLAVKTMVEHLEGKKVEKRIATGEYVATAENMNSDEMHALLNPAQFTDADEPRPEQKKYTLAVIPKGTTHEFWKSVHYGAAQAAREFGNVEVIWKGPLQENDREGQINVVQDFITRGVDGICLAPLDAQALIAPVKDARDAGIPTVIFDSGLADESVTVSYVATDNYHGGVLAARQLAKALGQKPKAE